MIKLLKKSIYGISCLLAVIAYMPVAQAADDDPIAKAIKARKAGFQLYSFYGGHLFAMAKGDMDYDAELASTMANNLLSVVSLNNGAMWPMDSDKSKRKGKTRAKKEIWQEGSKIGEKSMALKEAATSVAAVAGNGLDALRGEVGGLGQACKACHDDYRHKDF